MLKKDIEPGKKLYWNKIEADGSRISLKCKVIDVGKIWTWVNVYGCMTYSNLSINELSVKPLYTVINEKEKQVYMNMLEEERSK